MARSWFVVIADIFCVSATSIRSRCNAAPTVTFEGGKVIFAQKDANGVEAKGPATPIKLDPTRDPKEIDIGDKAGIQGIYSV